MTISTTDRRRDFLRTLVVMVTVVADRAVMHVRFEPGQKPVEATLPTTWDELQQRGIVSDKSTLTRPQYSLTPDGWADGLVSRPPDDLQERCGRLAAALKQVVKGRELDGFTVLKDLASAKPRMVTDFSRCAGLQRQTPATSPAPTRLGIR